jgi:hypothetical protein
MNKKLRYIYLFSVAFSVLLVFVGTQLSSICGAHHHRSRTPRSFIENSLKDCRETGLRSPIFEALCPEAPVIATSILFGTTFQKQFPESNFIPIGHFNARASPIAPV